MVIPILQSENTGFDSSDILVRLCTQLLRIILNVEKAIPNVTLYGDLGRHPTNILSKSRKAGFWQLIVSSNEDKILFSLQEKGLFFILNGCLTLSTLGKHFIRRYFEIYIFFIYIFSPEMGFDVSCKLSP